MLDKKSEDFFGAEYVRAEYQLLEVFKGSIETSGYLSELVYTNTGNCAVSLMVGVEYVFFLDKNNDFVVACSGTFPVFINENTYRVDILRKLRGKQ
jgi:hypothetical protein